MEVSTDSPWPRLEFSAIQATLETLHQWLQIVGKLRLTTMPWQNHSWHAALYVTAHGYSTGGIPYEGGSFQVDFDFKQHKLVIQSSEAKTETMKLRSRTVASFYRELFDRLERMGIKVSIHGSPNEMDPAIPFAENNENNTYESQAATDIWRAMLKANGVFSEFRSKFIGKCSPVHLFWGAFDLAVTRFSGNAAPLHPGGAPNMPLEVMQEAYSQEVSSAGFWPGSKDFPTPVFYAYAYPSGDDFATQKVKPGEAFYSEEMGEFLLKYEDVSNSTNPEATLMDFLQTTYEAAANAPSWDRKKLERDD